MNSPATSPTLRDDWQERRAYLASADRDNELVDVQLRVLDFLLKRYGDSPEARRPAQFPRPSAVYINQRAVLQRRAALLERLYAGGEGVVVAD